MRPTLLVPVLALVACSSRPPRGEVMLAIDTDMAAGKDFDRLQIEVRQQGAETFKKTFREFGQPGLEVHFPATFGIVQGVSPHARIQIRVITGKVGPGGDDEVGVPQNMVEIVTTVPSARTAMVPVHLEWLCRKSTKLEADGYVEGVCPEGATCVAGECVDWTVDAAKRPDYVEADIFGGGTAAGEGACFDTVACFTSGQAVVPDAECTIARPPGENVNVALVPAAGLGGICAADVCFVPLDKGTGQGWTEVADRVRLPKKVCEALASTTGDVRLRAVAVATVCPAKTPRLPPCGPWSAITTNRGGSRDAAVRDLPPP